MPEKQFNIAGRIIVPVYFRCDADDETKALKHVQDILNKNTISVISGDISTWNGREYPLLARRCKVEWYGSVNDDDMI
ncbi:hypothetical protein BSK59_13380 [Paenibacillus odorifer]|nr:hypothetical protein BSK59_13380 [Paenibacillus odorifer]